MRAQYYETVVRAVVALAGEDGADVALRAVADGLALASSRPDGALKAIPTDHLLSEVARRGQRVPIATEDIRLPREGPVLFVLSPSHGWIEWAGRRTALSNTALRLVAALALAYPRALTRRQLAATVWGSAEHTDDVATYLTYVRGALPGLVVSAHALTGQKGGGYWLGLTDDERRVDAVARHGTGRALAVLV